MKQYDLSKEKRYSSIKEAYNDAFKKKGTCILRVTQKENRTASKEYIIWDYKLWIDNDNKIIDDGFIYGGQLMPNDLEVLKKIERYSDKQKAIDRYVKNGDPSCWIFIDDETGEYIIDTSMTEALLRAGYNPAEEERKEALRIIYTNK